MPTDRRRELLPEEAERLAAGFHEEVAQALASRQRFDLAAWVREQIWDFEGAFAAYRQAARPLEALRVAIEANHAGHLDRALQDIEADGTAAVVDAAVALLQKRRRSMEAARLLALRDDRPEARAQALLRAGDRLGAARAMLRANRPREALELLMPGGTPPQGGAGLALAATLAWELGDAERAARFAQQARRVGESSPETVQLLARALGSLGHDLAAQIVLEGQRIDPQDAGVPGRYRVTGLASAGLTGAAYVGLDRVTLQEVEIHLLFAELPDAGPVDPAVLESTERFAAMAEAAAAIGHPAIRPILRLLPRAGLLVMPRAEGPTLRSLIRPPGMAGTLGRARGLAAFMAEGLAAAHRRGLVHGSLLPSQIHCDAALRPVLGPFGAYHLAGLAATHTGALEEIMVVSAPEIGRGQVPNVQSDLYAVGALLGGLLTGELVEQRRHLLALPSAPEVDLALALLDENPDRRPDIDAVLSVLHRPVADLRDFGAPEAVESTTRGRIDLLERALEGGIVVEPHESWSDPLLDALCEAEDPWLQPILDRQARALVLAAWPEGSLGVDEQSPRWRDLVPAAAFDGLADDLVRALQDRLRPTSIVRTPSGQWMLALDDLLRR